MSDNTSSSNIRQAAIVTGVFMIGVATSFAVLKYLKNDEEERRESSFDLFSDSDASSESTISTQKKIKKQAK